MANENPYDPPETESSESEFESGEHGGPSGLGGWLILVGIGIVLSPFRIGAMLLVIFVPIFADGTWEALTTPGSPDYHPFWGPLLMFEVIGNAAFMIGFFYLSILLFSKSPRFPKTYIFLSVSNFCFVLLDAYLGSLVFVEDPMFDPETAKEVVRSLVSLFIWVPYMLVSIRVKNTFVK